MNTIWVNSIIQCSRNLLTQNKTSACYNFPKLLMTALRPQMLTWAKPTESCILQVISLFVAVLCLSSFILKPEIATSTLTVPGIGTDRLLPDCFKSMHHCMQMCYGLTLILLSEIVQLCCHSSRIINLFLCGSLITTQNRARKNWFLVIY